MEGESINSLRPGQKSAVFLGPVLQEVSPVQGSLPMGVGVIEKPFLKTPKSQPG